MRSSSRLILALVSCALVGGCQKSSSREDSGLDAATDADTAISDGNVSDASDADDVSDAHDASDTADAGPDPLDPATWVEPERPVLAPAPPWEPDFPIVGTPGWLDSDEPLCVSDTGDISEHLVFANAAGVYVFAHIGNNPLNEKPWAGRPSGASLYFNDGTGWTRRLWAPGDIDFPSRASSIFVTDGGTLFLPGFGCGIMEVAPGPLTTETFQCGLETNPFDFTSLFVEGSGRAHAIAGGALHVRRADTGAWSVAATLPTDPSWTTSESALWSSEDIVFGATANQNVIAVTELGLENFSNDALAGNYVSAFGFSESDIWFGTSFPRLIHYDGDTWETTMLDLECPPAGVHSIWGVGDSLFFATQYAFGRLDENGVSLIVDMPCDTSTRIRQMTGRAETEIFLSIEDEPYAAYACGGTFVVWYDGTSFHRF